MRYALILACAALAGCGGTVIKDRPVEILRPVPQPCALSRPAEPAPLPTDWDSLDVKQKAAAVGKWALEWQQYGQDLNAATAACPEVEGETL